jgi:hypothetical protein
MIVGLTKKIKVAVNAAEFLAENPKIQFHGYTIEVTSEYSELERFDEAAASMSVEPLPGDWVIVKVGREYRIQKFPISSSGLLVAKVTCFYQSFKCN